jgi:SagB-type dehydrogenase family enzyme
MSLIPFILRPAAHDPDRDTREELEIAHGLTRFHRQTMSRRARQIGRYATDPQRLEAATRLRAPQAQDEVIALPDPILPDETLADCLAQRRSAHRSDLTGDLSLDGLSALLTLAVRCNADQASSTAEGVTYRLRPYASAGALYPCEIYVIRPGQAPLRYEARRHALVDYGQAIADFRTVETGPQDEAPPCAIVITAVLERSMNKYGGRGYRFALLEAGGISQNLLLGAEALGLPALAYGSYFDAELEHLIGVDGLEEVIVATVLVGGNAFIGDNISC